MFHKWGSYSEEQRLFARVFVWCQRPRRLV